MKAELIRSLKEQFEFQQHQKEVMTGGEIN